MENKTEEQIEFEKREKQEKLKKEAAAKARLPKSKYYYDVKIECLLPATLTYKVLAENAEQAATLIKGMQPNAVKHKLAGKRDIKMIVYDAGSSFIRFVKMLGR